MPIKRGIYILLSLLLLASCSVSKFIPDGERMLNKVEIISYNKENKAAEARSYVRQNPNSKWFSLAKVPMRIYCLSGKDSTKFINKVLRKIGEAPVIYDSKQAELTRSNIETMLRNNGYLHATVDHEAKPIKDNKVDAIYYLHERNRYKVTSVSREIEDSLVEAYILGDTAASLIKAGIPFSINTLNKERERITALLKENGFYKFQKEFITFVADTAHHSTEINLNMKVAAFRANVQDAPEAHRQYRFGNISVVSDAGLRLDDNILSQCDTMTMGNYNLLYNNEPFIRPTVLSNQIYIEPGEYYSQSKVNRTYNSFSQLNALRYATVRMRENTANDSLLDCFIMFERRKPLSVLFDLEGTNTAGDLGAAASLTFTNRNLFKGSEVLSLRLFGAYEAISGLSGYIKDSYFEYGAELGLRIPGGAVSTIIPAEKRHLRSETQFSLKFNSQERPEFERQLLSASWSYLWSRKETMQHKFDLLDLSYIYVPWISDTFKREYLDSISNRNSILKYNYENLLITKMGYSFSYNSTDNKGSYGGSALSIRGNIESSGNVLNIANTLLNTPKNSDGQHTFMNIAYAQYIKGDIDVTTRINFDSRNALVLHTGIGIAYPYGNSTILPFEKRYFSGGANSMRGWTVRGLGPGSFKNKNSNIDFINQSGDMKLDLNIEFRSRLFWKIHSALFIDAGNIWTIRDYKEQPGGQFDIKKFHKEIAFSYGMGLRFELDFFVFRLDCGMKAVNPALSGKDKYPLLNPDLDRDFALHFAVGYPF
ncbi:MAG: BamA/TamA family outer membrane protein [Bacteroidaceae bacterium]|nr:BamA/TamA family outer membrane protein [Bacteroidaceae bacterium]